METTTGAFKIKKRFLLGLASWLNLLPLAGKESRERSRFVTLASEALKEMEAERKEIVSKYAKKDENGDLEKTVDNGMERYVIEDGKTEELEKDYTELLDEEWVLDIGEGHKSKIRVVSDIVLNTDYKFGPAEGDSPEETEAKVRQANDYEKWCLAFEAVEL